MLVGPRAAEHEMRVAIDQARGHPRAAERVDGLGAEAGKFGPLADADDLAVRDADRAILDHARAHCPAALEGRDVAVDEQPVPHGPSP